MLSRDLPFLPSFEYVFSYLIICGINIGHEKKYPYFINTVVTTGIVTLISES